MKKLVLIAALALGGMLVAPAAPALASGGEGAHGEGGHGEAGHAAAGHAPNINWLNFDHRDPEAHREGPPLALAIFNFAVLLVLLIKFAGPAIKKSLASRSDDIRDALEEGKRLRDEAAAKLKEYEAKIAGVDAEVAKLIETIRATAEEEKARILANAEAQAAAVKQDAENRIAAEIERSRRALEREVVEAAIAAAETLLRANTRDDDQKRLVQDFITKVETNQPGAPS